MITLFDIRERAQTLRSRVQLRNGALYLYSLANVALTLWLVYRGVSPRYTAPGLLILLAHLFVIWQLWWRTSARPFPSHLMGTAALDYLRHELTRQRDALSGAWLWYVAPFMPGLLWELWLRATLHPATISPAIDHLMVLFLILGAVFFWVAVTLGFLLAASRLDLRLERLNTLRAE